MFNFIFYKLFGKKKMHESSLDLFCEEESDEYADEYSKEIELKAAELEITVDYYLAEFF